MPPEVQGNHDLEWYPGYNSNETEGTANNNPFIPSDLPQLPTTAREPDFSTRQQTIDPSADQNTIDLNLPQGPKSHRALSQPPPSQHSFPPGSVILSMQSHSGSLFHMPDTTESPGVVATHLAHGNPSAVIFPFNATPGVISDDDKAQKLTRIGLSAASTLMPRPEPIRRGPWPDAPAQGLHTKSATGDADGLIDGYVPQALDRSAPLMIPPIGYQLPSREDQKQTEIFVPHENVSY